MFACRSCILDTISEQTTWVSTLFVVVRYFGLCGVTIFTLGGDPSCLVLQRLVSMFVQCHSGSLYLRARPRRNTIHFR
ncbi:hypothetical protein V8E55_002792 [Tylopilus felleus]